MKTCDEKKKKKYKKQNFNLISILFNNLNLFSNFIKYNKINIWFSYYSNKSSKKCLFGLIKLNLYKRLF